MCLAILKPASVNVPIDHIRNGWIANSDGGGYGFVREGRAQIRKGFMKLKEFAAAYEKDAQDNPNSPFLLHFRIGTDGAKDETNTHPFRLEDGILIHNGMLSGTGAKHGVGPSDTALFVDMFKNHLNYDFVVKHKSLWNDAIGSSKLAMLYDDGRYTIVNEQLGWWVDGVWYSNQSFKGWGGQCSLYDEAGWPED